MTMQDDARRYAKIHSREIGPNLTQLLKELATEIDRLTDELNRVENERQDADDRAADAVAYAAGPVMEPSKPVKPQYQCGLCGKLHSSHDEAHECCGKSIECPAPPVEESEQQQRLCPTDSWDEYEKRMLATFRGGHHEHSELKIYQHGIRTVFNCLRDLYPQGPPDTASVPLKGPPDGYARLGCGTLAKVGMTVWRSEKQTTIESIVSDAGIPGYVKVYGERQCELSKLTAEPPAPKATAEEALRQMLDQLRSYNDWGTGGTGAIERIIAIGEAALEKE